ncbi:pectinesterase family protein [Jeotgalibaca porci]|uniref:pectinesterase family protein n=2 Tax=Jeotgalibaca porci TaxID=1868793 RepID=UPI00359F9165
MYIKIKLLLNKIVKALNLIPEKLRENGIVKGRVVQENSPKNKFLKLFYMQYHPVLYVGKNTEEFSTIQAAINNANDTPKYPVTIKISPGEYNESVKIRGRRYVSLVGSGRENCVLQNNGDYWNPPLEIAGKSSVFNMTIIAVRNNDINSKLPAYAIHHDFDGEGKSVISNCKIISQQNSAVGIGLRNNQTLVIDNCELYSSASHSLYAHNRIKKLRGK